MNSYKLNKLRKSIEYLSLLRYVYRERLTRNTLNISVMGDYMSVIDLEARILKVSKHVRELLDECS